MLALDARFRSLLSNDLGAVAGLLFDIGSGRYSPPPATGDERAVATWAADVARVRDTAAKDERARAAAREGDRTHTELQGWLRDLGMALGYDVWIAANDGSRSFGAGSLADGCLTARPPTLASAAGADAVALIDILWLERGGGEVAAAFEVEHTTSIYSGIIRLLDLALGAKQASHKLFLVAPDEREDDVREQFRRPAFSRVSDLAVRYLPYSELERHREAMARFGSGVKAIEAVARSL